MASALAGIAGLSTPDPRGREVPSTEFSAARAYEHLRQLAVRPRPTGSVENRRVRNYVMDQMRALGLETDAQTASVRGVTVHNLLARVAGDNHDNAVLLAAHHDSVEEGPGAADAGVAMAAFLEVLRALQQGDRLRSDVIVLLTDAEEIGLLGARAFVDAHPWARDVRVILNFEARGNGGQVFMFETVNESRWLIDTYAEAVPRPVTSSIAPLAYDRLPNITDVDVFDELDVPTLNFAFFRGHPYYHSPADTVDHVARGSLQHVGDTALALARAFANEDLGEPRPSRPLAYFSVGGMVVTYSVLAARLGLLLPLALFTVVIIAARRRRQLHGWGIVAALFVMLATAVAAAVLTLLVLFLIRVVHPDYRQLLGDGFLPRLGDLLNGHLYFLALTAATIGAAAGLLALLRRRMALADVTTAGLLCWLLLAVGTTLFLPEASYPFAIAATCALAGAVVWMLVYDWRTDRLGAVAVLGVSALPVLVVLVPLLYNAYVAFTLGRSHLLMVFVALAVALFAPHIEVLSGGRRWTVPTASAVVFAMLLLAGAVTDGFDPSLG